MASSNQNQSTQSVSRFSEFSLLYPLSLRPPNLSIIFKNLHPISWIEWHSWSSHRLGENIPTMLLHRHRGRILKSRRRCRFPRGFRSFRVIFLAESDSRGWIMRVPWWIMRAPLWSETILSLALLLRLRSRFLVNFLRFLCNFITVGLIKFNMWGF